MARHPHPHPVVEGVMTQVDVATTPPRLGVTIAEACRLLSCSKNSVYRALDAGTLGSYQLGRARRVTVASITAFVNQSSSSSQ